MNSVLEYVPSGCQQRIIETKNNMLIMSSCYSKQKLAPVAFAGANFGNAAEGGCLTLDTVKCLFVNTNQGERQGFRHQQFGVVTDPYIPNRYYIKLGGHYADNSGYAYIVTLTEDGNDLTVESALCPGRYADIQNIIDINEYYVYFLSSSMNNNSTIMYRLDKRTNAIVACASIGTGNRTIYRQLYSDDNRICFFTRFSYDNFQLYRYDKLSGNVVTVNIPYTNTSATYSPPGDALLYDDTHIDGQYAYIYFPYRYNGSNFAIKALKVDITKDITQLGLTNSSWFTACSTSTSYTWNNRNAHAIHRFWIADGYLYYIFYDEYYRINDFSSINVQGIHIFKIKTNGYLDYIGYDQIDSQNQIISMTYSSDKKVMLLGFPQSFRVLRLNESTHKYEISDSQFNLYTSSVGFDEYDRIWIQRLDNSVEVFSLEDPERVFVEFEKPAYIHYGDDIDSYIKFSAVTFLNTDSVGRYIFELTGSAHFTDNGLQKIEVQYTGGEFHVPIVVTGPEQLTCKVYYIKESD